MSSAKRLADEIKKHPELALGNPLDVQRFAISWLLAEIDRLEERIEQQKDDMK